MKPFCRASGDIGRGITMITPDGERTFVIDPGEMDALTPAYIPEEIIAEAAAVGGKRLSAACFWSADSAGDAADTTVVPNDDNVPVVMSLGTQPFSGRTPRAYSRYSA